METLTGIELAQKNLRSSVIRTGVFAVMAVAWALFIVMLYIIPNFGSVSGYIAEVTSMIEANFTGTTVWGILWFFFVAVGTFYSFGGFIMYALLAMWNKAFCMPKKQVTS